MTRKLLLLATALTMVFAISGVTSTEADAQTTTTTCRTYYNVIVTCPGTTASTAFDAGASAGSGAASTGVASSGTTTTPAATAGTTTALAVTGAESEALGYIGAGLLGMGCLAAAAARRRNSDIS